jgi:SAM-dependent methyltransferase
MAYEHFYEYYDELMNDVPYEKYIEHTKRYLKADDTILDLGCGSGIVLLELLKLGFNITGVDISEQMLLVTQTKLQELGLSTALYCDDMRQIRIIDEYNVVISYLDTINYLTSEVDVRVTFQNVYNSLKKDGYFIFDIHSLYKVHHVFDGYSYNEAWDEFIYLWNTYVEENEQSSEVLHELNFFIKQQNGLYERLEEFHKQVVFPLDFYIKALEEVGFTIEDLSFDFKKAKNEGNCDKIIVTAKKCLL